MTHSKNLGVFLFAMLSSTSATSVNASMNCGQTAVCGVLTLESGLGPGVYNHSLPSVHGLWPEVGQYGTSQCLPPTVSKANPTKVYPCYVAGGTSAGQLTFETHEWTKHGICSGVKDVDDFFGQICSLSSAPLALMAKHSDFDSMKAAVVTAGYEVFNTDNTDDQLSLSACLEVKTGLWKLAPLASFGTACGVAPPTPPTPAPAPPPPTPAATSCVHGKHGPPCASDSDCSGVADCVRCAHSGFCTDIPLF